MFIKSLESLISRGLSEGRVLSITSIIRPGLGDITTIFVDKYTASGIECVTKQIVFCVDFHSSNNCLFKWSRTISSNAPNGSSINKMSASKAKARAILTLCCLPLVKFGVPNPEVSSPSGDALPQLSQLKNLAKDPSLWRLNASVLTVHLLITCFFVQVPTLLTQASFGLDEHWKIYTPILFISILILVVLMKVCKPLQTSTSFIISLALMASGFGLLLLPEVNWLIIIVAGTLFFGGFNYMEAHMPVMVSSIAPAGKKGSAMGIYASCQFFGAFLGGLISGLLTGWLGPKLALVACLVFIAVAMYMALGLQKATKVKRVTLAIQSSDGDKLTANKIQLESDFAKLDGVQEVFVDVEKNAVYLKVDSKGYDIEKANALIS